MKRQEILIKSRIKKKTECTVFFETVTIIAEIDTNKLVTISEFLSPINLPKNPDIIDAINGNAKIEISILSF